MNIKDLLGDAYKEGMTVEEIETALAGVTLPTNNSAEVERLKTALSKSNSEAANYKKQLKDKMTEDEQRQAEEAETREKLQKDYEALLRKTTVSENKAQLLSLGYEEGLAAETAEAMADGDMAKVMANQKKHLEAYAKQVRAEALKDTPKPTGSGGTKQMTLENLRKMSSRERYEYSVKNPEEYKSLYTNASANDTSGSE